MRAELAPFGPVSVPRWHPNKIDFCLTRSRIACVRVCAYAMGCRALLVSESVLMARVHPDLSAIV